MSKKNTKIDVSQFSNMPAVLAAAKRAAQNLVPAHDNEAARAEALQAGEADILRAVDQLAHRAAELAMDAR